MSHRIDSHVHNWATGRGDYGWLTPDKGKIYRDFGPRDLAPELDAAGIDRVMLVQAAQSVAETEFLLGIAHAWDRVAGVVGWVDMERSDAPVVMARLAGMSAMKGIRPMIQDIPDPDWMLQASLAPAFRAVVDLDLCFDALVLPIHLKNLLRVLARQSDMRTVICHGAKPRIADGAYAAWAADMARLAAETSAWCKLSGLVTEAGPDWTVAQLRPYVDHLLEIFGPDRLIWGSDWPVMTLAADYPSWCNATETLLAGLSDAERSKILGGNAVEAYRL